MTGYRRGDVVLVPTDFTDQSDGTVRPAVVVSSDRYNQQTPDVIIAPVTGHLGANPTPGDLALLDWQGEGLLRPSLARMKLATVEASVIKGKLGVLTAADMEALDHGLRDALDLT